MVMHLIWIVCFIHVFGCSIAVREQYPRKIGCDNRVGGPENIPCPFAGSTHWNCLDCGKGDKVYHCAKNTTGVWTEVCAVVQICGKGQEPLVTRELSIVCTFCKDPERYNPEESTPSNEMSGCQMKKTPIKDHKIECEDSYDKSNSNSVHWMNRMTRCEYEADYIPIHYKEESYNWTCSFQNDLECWHAPCESSSTGIKQKRGIGYHCYPVEGNITTSTIYRKVTVFFNRSETYPRTVEPTTVTTNSTVSTPLTTTEEEKAQENKHVVGIVVGVIFAVVIVVVVSIFLWQRSKAKGAMPVGPLEVNDIKYQELKLSWNSPKRTHLSPHTEPLITNYHVEKRQKDQRNWVDVASYQTNATSISYQLTELDPDTDYEFRVKAEFKGKLSLPLTTQRMYKTKRLTVPEIPQGPLSIIEVTTTSITLSWEPPDDDGGAPITNYSVKYRSTSDNSWIQGGVLEGDIRIWRQTNLVQGKAYMFQVTARNSLGESNALESELPQTLLCKPSKPENLKAIANESNQVTLSWATPTDNGGTDILKYLVRIKQNDGTWKDHSEVDSSVHSQIVDDLKTETPYYFAVCAENKIGIGDICQTTNPTTLPNRSGNMTYCMSTPRSLKPTPSFIRDCYKTVIDRNLVQLKNDLASCTLDFMREKGIGIQSEHMELESIRNPYERNGRILQLIQTRGFEAYKSFKTILHETEQFPLLYALERTENEEIQKQNDAEEEREVSDQEQHEASDHLMRAREIEEPPNSNSETETDL